jgi:hypothetical protein
MVTLLDLNAFKISDLVWIEESPGGEKGEEDDDMIFVESYFHLMAEILKL